MKLLKSSLDFIVFSNMFISVAIACLSLQTFLLFDVKVDYNLLLFIFCSTFFVYSFHRYLGIVRKKEISVLPLRLLWAVNHKKWIILLVFFSVPCIIFSSMKLTRAELLILVPLTLVAFGYLVPIISSGSKYVRLRDISGIKIFLITLTVSCVSVLLPVLSAKRSILIEKPEILFVFMERIFFVFAIAIPFDIRDMKFDEKSKTKTIPVIAGEAQSKMIALTSVVMCVATVVVHYFFSEAKIAATFAILISLLISGVVIYKSSQKRSEYFFSVLVESMMIVQTVSVYIFQRI